MRYATFTAGGLMLLAALVLGPRLCVKVWRDPAYAEKLIQAARILLPFSCATVRGVTRGALPLWAGDGFIGAGVLAAAALPAGPAHAAPLTLMIGMVCFALGFAGIGLNVWIIWFNKPRRLVPPHMRGEAGLVCAWWQRLRRPTEQRGAAARAGRR